MAIAPQEQPHLDRIRVEVLGAALELAPFEGWTAQTLAQAAAAAVIDPGALELACPRGVVDLLSYWSAQCDRTMLKALEDADLDAMRVRERVTFAVQQRLAAIGPQHREAASRAAARLAMPDALITAKQLLWQSADAIWRALGDRSTDYNYYTKRAILSAVLGSTLMVWLDGDEDRAAAFLDRRIENVMAFERFKGRVRQARAQWPDPIKALARLRYGSGRARPRRM